MFVEFESLPGGSRVWVYQADRKLTASDVDFTHEVLRTFVGEWAAHGAPLRSSYKILHDRFVIIAVDEMANDTSGCSIDASVHIMKKIGEKIHIDFFNRTVVPFFIEGKITPLELGELKQKFKEGVWSGETMTINTLARTVEEVTQSWMIPAAKSWINRYADTVKIR